MLSSVVLHGYRFSVYNRIAAMVLHKKGIAYEREEVDPFAPDLPAGYRKRHPFARVPVLAAVRSREHATLAVRPLQTVGNHERSVEGPASHAAVAY